jgi:hypothetical protein
LSGCATPSYRYDNEIRSPTFSQPTKTEPPTETEAPTQTEPTDPPKPEHSPLYIPDLSVEDVITYFNEVCLDAEFTDNGNPNLVQKWDIPICYTILGETTPEDLDTLNGFVAWLNTIEGFPGMYEADDPVQANLSIHFCSEEDLLNILGDNYYGTDGGVIFWYEDNAIYDATICYRTDLDQHLRNSVILEEIYNGLGPVQDTDLRSDSIIYSAFSEPQSLTAIDELLLKLLYHPDILCGMDAEECEAVIRQLYY